jgi:hypothetical protein
MMRSGPSGSTFEHAAEKTPRPGLWIKLEGFSGLTGATIIPGGCDSGRLDAHRSGPAQTLPTELDQRTFTFNRHELNTHEI